jgi:lipoate-protein ligase A
LRAWALEERSGTVGHLHEASAASVGGPGPVVRTATRARPTGRGLVLGSTQAVTVADRAACARTATEVVRRRSGGGAVLVVPGWQLWVDLVVPAGDPLWADDVARAAWWVGEAWAAAVATAGVGAPPVGPEVGPPVGPPVGPEVGPPVRLPVGPEAGPETGPEVRLQVWKGPLQHRPWSALACFAGVGPGEVLDGSGAKVVGISQRRSRYGALFQCSCLLHWGAGELVALLALSPEERLAASSDLAGAGRAVAAGEDALWQALVEALPS